jgi:putative hemolysin
MIEAVVQFRNRTVAQVMTPRTEIEAIELTNDLGKVTKAVREIGHSRIPVYEESLDHIVGVFYVKDLMKWLAGEARSGHGKGFDFKTLLRPAFFVPETKTIRELLPELLNKRVHIAMVADEYGGTAGLVTIEDIIEEVFGDIQDEYEAPEEETAEVKVEVASKTAEIDARAYIEDVNAEIKPLGVELPESEDYDTVGGFVTVTLGRIPAAGETFVNGKLLVTVLGAEATRVTKVRVQVSEPDAAPLEPTEEPPATVVHEVEGKAAGRT